MRREPRAFAALIAAVASLASLHCTSASTSLTGPSTNKCQIAVSTGQSSFGPAGGSASIGIEAARDCTWSVAADAPWISIAGDRDGQGEAEVSFVVAVNPVPSARTGAIAVGSQRVELSQAPAPCTFQLSQSNNLVGSGGGRLSVGVVTLTGCSWTASSDAGWIVIESGAAGSTSGAVALSVAANGGAARVGQATIAGERYTVTQDASPAPPSAPTPPAPTPPATPGPPAAPTPPAPTPPTAPAPTPPAPTPPAPTPPSPTPPAPTPTPPAPTPPPATAVAFDGKVSGLSGGCPNISFAAGGRKVVADRSTAYSGGRCGDLSKGDKVHVKGIQGPDGTVIASQISLDQQHED